MVSLSSLSSLLKQTHIEDDEQVLVAAEAALKQSKGDVDAQHVKVVALLKLDRFDEALKTIEAGGQKLKDKAVLEHAYALYKSGNASAAAQVAQGGSQRALRHVEAQASYRAEDFARAADLYKQLASDLDEDAEIDLRINAGAVDAQLEWAGQGGLVSKKKPGREDLEVFETAFNAACASIARGELGQGEVLLKRAYDLGGALEDLSEEERQAELVPVTIQRAYVLARLGRREEAERLLEGIDVRTISDVGTRNIARMNRTAVAATTTNPYLAQRLATAPEKTTKTDQPFEYQSSVLTRNEYVADLLSLKYAGVIASTERRISQQAASPSDPFTNSLSVFNIAARTRSGTGKDASKLILPILEQRPKDIGTALTAAQLYILAKNTDSAIHVLQTLASRLEQGGESTSSAIRFTPGLVGALVSLYSSQGRKGHARSELAKAAQYWLHTSATQPNGVYHLLKAAGGALSESQDKTELDLAHDIFAYLQKTKSDDKYVIAGVVATSSDDSAKSAAKSLTSVDRLIIGVDAEALENAGIARPPASTTAAVTTRKRPAEATKSKKPNKIRKTRLPKDYDPSKTPDPERWLPLRDRSTYKPKGKKGKARQALLSQGTVVNESDGSRPATPGADVIKQKQAGGGAANKKKKKGGKW